MLTSAQLETYHEALRKFDEGDLDASKKLFAALSSDPVSQSYLARIEKEGKIHLDGWSPTWNLTEK